MAKETMMIGTTMIVMTVVEKMIGLDADSIRLIGISAAVILFLTILIIHHIRRIRKNRMTDEWDVIDGMEGHEFERWCADLLRDNGFENVEVTKGSHDQGVDILAEKDEIKYAIQCKCYASNLGNTPVQEVFTGKTIYRCHVGVVMTNSYFTDSAKKAAEATGVLLWDRDKLDKMMGEA